jgi:hypothetical protein
MADGDRLLSAIVPSSIAFSSIDWVCGSMLNCRRRNNVPTSCSPTVFIPGQAEQCVQLAENAGSEDLKAEYQRMARPLSLRRIGRAMAHMQE